MKRAVLTRRQLDVMSVLWRRGEATIAEIHDSIDANIAYTSVSTVVRILELHGYVVRKPGGRANTYIPRLRPEDAGKTAIDRILDTIYDGSPLALVTHLIGRGKLSRKELAALRALADREMRRSK